MNTEVVILQDERIHIIFKEKNYRHTIAVEPIPIWKYDVDTPHG